MLLTEVSELIGLFGSNGCHDGVQFWDGIFWLFNQLQTSMEGPIPNLDSIYNFTRPLHPKYEGLFSVVIGGNRKRSHPRSELLSIGTTRNNSESECYKSHTKNGEIFSPALCYCWLYWLWLPTRVDNLPCTLFAISFLKLKIWNTVWTLLASFWY